MFDIHVFGNTPAEALGLAIWAAFDKTRELNPSIPILKFDAATGERLAKAALDEMVALAGSKARTPHGSAPGR